MPLRWDAWRDELEAAGCLEQFADLPVGLRDGFPLGVSSSVLSTFTPRNHKSSLAYPAAIRDHIATELSARRYSGPFHPSRLESLIGPFRSSPLGVVPKPNGTSFRIVQDFSYPRDSSSTFSVNSEIDINDFPCEWGTFADCALLILNAPPGTQVSVNDVEKAYRNMPVWPAHQNHVVVMWDDLVYMDHCVAFGGVSSGGIFGRAGDAISRIFKFHGIPDLVKWVDDFAFFRYPSATRLDGSFEYTVDESIIFTVAARLGWPWSLPKHVPFAFSFVYVGFLWDIPARTVELPEKKKTKYLLRLAPWLAGASVSRKDVEVIVGTLNHCSLAVPDGRSRLPSLYRLSAGFRSHEADFVKHRISAAALSDVEWWRARLSDTFCGSNLYIPPMSTSHRIFVDASTSWGIGLVVNDRWFAWKLKDGWRSEGRDIGWAEMVAVELAVWHLVADGTTDTQFLIHSDNQGVCGALDAGCSRSLQQNRVLQHIVGLFAVHGVWAKTVWVASKDNIADAPSRGVFPSVSDMLPSTVKLPHVLIPYVSSPVV
ncbi:hypothetical protein VTO73DRAFT_3310 [Trametes versicolor]